TCHNDIESLRQARRSVRLDRIPVSPSGENQSLGDGLVRFLTPPRALGELQPFDSYAGAHPLFYYEREGAIGPANLKFQHERRTRADIPAVQGRKLDCASCHQPGPGNVLYQPIRYKDHCAQCHSLQIQPTLPKVLIPHGDPEKVRYFLASLDVS